MTEIRTHGFAIQRAAARFIVLLLLAGIGAFRPDASLASNARATGNRIAGSDVAYAPRGGDRRPVPLVR